jgi:hypothetical protein
MKICGNDGVYAPVKLSDDCAGERFVLTVDKVPASIGVNEEPDEG